jgi:hypothetical protein
MLSQAAPRQALARELIAQLHLAFVGHGRPAGLEPALCAYVEYWRGRGVDRTRILDVTRIFIDRVSADHPPLGGDELAAFEAMSSEMLNHCLSLVTE